ncbi:MAG: head GIN domain-containing protein [Prolixibacteraceae bacterium]|nr:head GIN domain-containing protein [Prolixibacteraceae bacterium]
MKLLFVSLVVLPLFVFSGTNVNAEGRERKVDPFSEISLRVPGDLFLTQGDRQHIEIVAKPTALDEILTEVKEDKLIIRFPGKNYVWKDFESGKIVIYVTVPEINALSVSGSGDIICEDGIKTRMLDLAVSGSGNIKLQGLRAEQLKVAISGSGDVVIRGNETATDLSVAISGSGNLKALDFPVEDALVKVAGSGNCTLHAKNRLTVKVAGSGTVKYRGAPQVDKTVIGSGSVANIE